MKKFLKKIIVFLFIGSLPIFALLAVYINSDPFKVIYSYPSYYKSGEISSSETNRDYVSTETFIKNYPNNKYNSFIFGNSRSIFYEINDWKKHVPGGNYFHFDASGETVYGIYKKISYMDKNNMPIKNAVIILDTSTLKGTTDSKGHLFVKHPVLSGHYLFFHLEFIKTFCTPSYLKSYLPFLFFNIKSDLSDRHIWDYDNVTNELKWSYYENKILINSDDYYLSKKKQFYKRDTIQQYAPIVIKEEQIKMLTEISTKFKKDHTNYKIIISPLYDQIKINRTDLLALKFIFGNEHVFDFSGINSFTNNMYNYYESSHYRPHVAREILNEIYNNE